MIRFTKSNLFCSSDKLFISFIFENLSSLNVLIENTFIAIGANIGDGDSHSEFASLSRFCS